MLGSKLAQHLYAQSQCNEPVESLLGTPSKSVQASVESGIASQTTFLNFPMEGFPGEDQIQNQPGAESPETEPPTKRKQPKQTITWSTPYSPQDIRSKCLMVEDSGVIAEVLREKS